MASWRPSTASAISGRRTFEKAFAASRRSIWSTATCRPSNGLARLTGKESNSACGSDARPGLKEEDTITELMEEQLKDLEDVAPVANIEFEVGDSVVYPHHGAGKVIRKEQKEVLGESREYLTIKILHNDMTVMVPTSNAAVAGLRRVIDEETVKKVLAVLQDECSEMPKNWNRRFKHNRDKIKTGDIYELAEVVRNLATREAEKGLSTGEKQMFTRAKKILASELMYALEMDEDEVEHYIHHLITEAADDDGKVAVAAK
jgi:CarD family transcriptional regulator